MARIGLTSPWVTFYHEVSAFFEKDSDVKVIYDEEENILTLYVENSTKAAALTELLPVEKDFGTITMQIRVVPANQNNMKKLMNLRITDEPTGKLFEAALDGNKRLSQVVHIAGIFNNPMTYVVFKKEVVQYFNDSLGDINGVCSTLMQNIANDIFENKEGVYFCTDVNSVSSTALSTWNPAWSMLNPGTLNWNTNTTESK